jgi:hypothetical protein
MRLEDSFYLFVVDEIRAQPNMLAELSKLGPTKKVVSVLGKMAPVLGPVGQPELVINTALAPKVQHALGDPPVNLAETLTEWRQSATADAQRYATACRSALCLMIWRLCQQAEEAINIAKYQHDNWALAHYVYGLLRGLTGDAGKAHFELYLASHREPYPEAKARIERALDLVR